MWIFVGDDILAGRLLWRSTGHRACYLAPRNRLLQALAVTVAILIDPFPECQLLGARSSEFSFARQRHIAVPSFGLRKTEFRRPGTVDACHGAFSVDLG